MRDDCQGLYHIEKVISENPDDPDALLARTIILRRKNDLQECGAILESLFSNLRTPMRVRIAAGYWLARLLDEQKEFELAMGVLQSAKQLQLASAGQLLKLSELDSEKNDDMTRRIDAGLLSSDGQRARSHHPLALLAGFPRSGTTLLESAISQHPRLVTAEETPVFNQTVIRPSSQKYGAFGGPVEILSRICGADAARFQTTYLEKMQQFIHDKIGDRILVDKNPVLTVAIPFFKKVFHQSRFIILLRDPRDVVLSCFMLPLPQLNRFNVGLPGR